MLLKARIKKYLLMFILFLIIYFSTVSDLVTPYIRYAFDTLFRIQHSLIYAVSVFTSPGSNRNNFFGVDLLNGTYDTIGSDGYGDYGLSDKEVLSIEPDGTFHVLLPKSYKNEDFVYFHINVRSLNDLGKKTAFDHDKTFNYSVHSRNTGHAKTFSSEYSDQIVQFVFNDGLKFDYVYDLDLIIGNQKESLRIYFSPTL